jgi:hypothetical protein
MYAYLAPKSVCGYNEIENAHDEAHLQARSNSGVRSIIENENILPAIGVLGLFDRDQVRRVYLPL